MLATPHKPPKPQGPKGETHLVLDRLFFSFVR
jgi:hypothetical protein